MARNGSKFTAIRGSFRNVFCLGRSRNPVKFAKFAIISNGFLGKRLVKLIDSFFWKAA